MTRPQLELNLTSPTRWGGRRPGAGRKPGKHPRDQHRRRAPVASRFPCHVTLRIRRGVPSLRSMRIVAAFETSLRDACERGRFRVVHYSLMRNHAHLVVEAATSHDLACGMKSICARLAHAVNRASRRRGSVLADRYHCHVLRTPREVRNAIAYVLLNARKHASQLGRSMRRATSLDGASSGRWFAGWRLRIRAARDAPAVAAPRTWLLAVGWHRFGLIDPSEVPGTG
jgi:REP element-mobilizing transposase RayT